MINIILIISALIVTVVIIGGRVTQAVSRWETGETIPNTETLKLLSKEFNVTINTLLGAPKSLICQCCGMPLVDEIVGHDRDGFLNEDYCKWCYADGIYTYSNMDDLIDVCVKHFVKDGFTEQQAREHMMATLPTLDYWKRYDELGDNGQFEIFKNQLIDEINQLHIEGIPKLEKLNALVGSYVNLAYPLPSGASVKFLNDRTTYLGNQLESEFDDERCFWRSGKYGFYNGLHLSGRRNKSRIADLQKEMS